MVLVEPQHPGNVGAAARAMLTMGLTDLRLVAPADWLDPGAHPQAHSEAWARASGALSVIEGARCYPDLAAAIADCGWAVGTSARSRRFDWPLMTPRQAAHELTRLAPEQTVAAVFGRERSGLSNAELDLCSAHLHIPANPDYSSLNLAAAVQVVCYEIRMARLDQGEAPESSGRLLATSDELEGFYGHLKEVLTAAGFLDPGQPKMLMRRLRRLFNRSALQPTEIHILRGILKALDPRRRNDH